MIKYFLLLNLLLVSTSLPVAILHGFFDSCTNPYFSELSKILKYNLGDYARCIESGGGSDSLSFSFQKQAEIACSEISNDKNFEGDFSLLTISQGGVLGRYIVEKCQMKGRVKRFVSFGGPMSGTSQVPFCLSGVTCYLINSFVDKFIYSKGIQNNIGPAGYYRTAAHNETYIKSNSFLVNLNNEGDYFDQDAKDRFIMLEKLILIGFTKDKMISPKESAGFQEYDEHFNLVPMKETYVYKKDLFGLKTLDEKKDVIKVVYLKGEHIEFDISDVLSYAVPNL